MESLNGLSTEVRYCAECDSRQVVNYWKHSEASGVVRYQCERCATQTEDLTVVPVDARGLVRRMSDVLGIEPSEYVEKFGDKPVRHRADGGKTVSSLEELYG